MPKLIACMFLYSIDGLLAGDPRFYQLDLISSTAWSNGIVGLYYRRHR